jgi:hypothetical protein
MKREKVIACLLIYALSLTILGGTIVFAPNPNPGNPLVPLDVLVTNTDPIQVTIDSTQNVNVEIPDGVEVTNTVTVDGTVEVDDSDPIDVEVPDGVEIKNTNPIPVDISGWLHTTQSAHQNWVTFDSTANYGQIFVDTEGYREITVVFDSSQDDVVFGLAWELDGEFRWAEGWKFAAEKPPTFTTPLGTTPSYFFKTYPVQGELLEIFWYASAGTLASGDLVSVAYYMTT